MSHIIDMTGKKMGRLTVLFKAPKDKFHGRAGWVCQCECGNKVTVTGKHLRTGNTKSCGCFRNDQVIKAATSHGHAKRGHATQTYHAWESMKSRCTKNRNTAVYRNYRARGITICPRWGKFENFLADMGECPEGTTLDRIDNNKGYAPENCRWATWEEQQNNRRNNRVIRFKGREKTLSEWAKFVGLKRGTLESRLDKLGWPVEKALTTPVRQWKSRNAGQA